MPLNDYLREGFNPQSLKISELRRILTENTVAYPSSSKKKDLLKLYDEFIVPMIPELREKYGISRSNNDNEGDIEIVESKIKTQEKKRKLEDDFSNAFHSRTSSISSVSSIEEDIIKELRKNADTPSTPKRKKPKYDIKEKKTTPILQKVASKKVSEPFSKNITPISKFDISNSSISEEEHESEESFQSEIKKSQLYEKQLTQNTKERKPTFDFSYKRQNFGQNSNNLKVSAEFGEQLQNIVLENNDKKESDITNFDSTDNLHKTETSLEVINDQSQVSIKDEDIKEKKEPLDESIVSQTQDYSIPTAKNGIDEVTELSDVGIEMPISSSHLIRTPDLPTSQDVITSEQLTKMVKNNINDGNGDCLQPENVNWLTNPTEKATSTDIIDLKASKKETKADIIDLEEIEDEIESNDHIDNDLTENHPTDDTDLSINRSNVLIKTKTSFIFKQFVKFSFKSFLYLTFGLILSLVIWFYQNNIYTGYCGQEQHFPTFRERYPEFLYFEKIDSILTDYKPSCIPCPENGICFPYMNLKCKPEYKVERSPIDIFGLFPFRNRCVRDDKKKELINEVVSKSLDFLRFRNAQMACGESKDDMESGIAETDLFNIFQESKTSSLEDEEFQDIWEQVVELLKKQPDIIYRQVSTIDFFNDDIENKEFFTNKLLQIPIHKYRSCTDTKESIRRHGVQGKKGHLSKENRPSQNRYFRSTSKKYITLKCHFELEIIRTYQRFKHFIWFGLLSVLLLKVIQIKIQNYFLRKSKIKHLTNVVIERLKKNKIETPDVPYLSSVQLRDILINDEANIKLRNSIWNEVTKNVESNNANIKSSLLEIHGDMMRCWEWIGPIENKATQNK
ncbi:Src1p PWA37_004015 [Arxiozyma heterogenica]|uniref:Src1p n=1 Tax=Arxiozyma heterogenica TaxID=278026 RepID=UPI002EE92BFD